MPNSPIYLSRYDHLRLRGLLEADAGETTARALARELARATVVPSHARFPSTVATVDSRVVLEDVRTGELREVVLALPGQHAGEETVSVLDELGTALLGCSVGDTITVNDDGETLTLRLLHVVQSPLAGAGARLTLH